MASVSTIYGRKMRREGERREEKERTPALLVLEDHEVCITIAHTWATSARTRG